MKGHRYHAAVAWEADGDFAGGAYSRGHLWRFDGGVTVPASASPTVVPHHAVAAAVDPEEAFVAALSSCHMLWFLELARRDGLVVAAYEDAAFGEMSRTARGRFAVTKVTLRPTIAFRGEVPDDARLADLHERAHGACFIANSVTSEIVVEAEPAVAATASARGNGGDPCATIR